MTDTPTPTPPPELMRSVREAIARLNCLPCRLDDNTNSRIDEDALKADHDFAVDVLTRCAKANARMREYIGLTEYWQLDPHDAKERTSWFTHRLPAREGPTEVRGLVERAQTILRVLETGKAKFDGSYVVGPTAYGEATATVRDLLTALTAQSAKPTGTPQGRCETTLTERFAYSGCKCGTYEGNLGPCKTFLPSVRPDRCVYCDHTIECHHAVGPQSAKPPADVVRWRQWSDYKPLGEHKDIGLCIVERIGGELYWLPLDAIAMPEPRALAAHGEPRALSAAPEGEGRS